MKLAVSNIAWPEDQLDRHAKILAETGCSGIEVSPSRLWPKPEEVGSLEVNRFLKLIQSYHLEVPSIHTLTFGRPDLALFDTEERRKKLIGHLKTMCILAEKLECPFIVFGSPAARNSFGLKRDALETIATQSFYEIGENAKAHGVTFLIEPLTRSETGFINTCEEAIDLIKLIGHESIHLHVDLRVAFEEEDHLIENIKRFRDYIKHFHVSDPGLMPPGTIEIEKHQVAAKGIQNINYQGYISIEMREGSSDSKEQLRKAIDFVQTTYLHRAYSGNMRH